MQHLTIPTIDPEFQSLIAPLTADELQQLENNIRKDGCRDPLVTWNGILLDGHNRFTICEKLHVLWSTTEIDLPDRDAAKAWIITNQLGRRNLAPYQRAELVLKLEPLIAKKAKINQGKRTDISQNSVERVDTQKELAKISGLSHDTIHKAKVISNSGTEEAKQRLRTSASSIHKEYELIKPPKKKPSQPPPSKPAEVIDVEAREVTATLRIKEVDEPDADEVKNVEFKHADFNISKINPWSVGDARNMLRRFLRKCFEDWWKTDKHKMIELLKKEIEALSGFIDNSPEPIVEAATPLQAFKSDVDAAWKRLHVFQQVDEQPPVAHITSEKDLKEAVRVAESLVSQANWALKACRKKQRLAKGQGAA